MTHNMLGYLEPDTCHLSHTHAHPCGVYLVIGTSYMTTTSTTNSWVRNRLTISLDTPAPILATLDTPT